MKELILIRHAKSSWKDNSLDDFNRPLNKRGEKNAPFMAKVLKKLINNPDLIICSTAKRTRLTLDFFLKEFDYKNKIIFEDSIYESSYENILKVIKNIDKKYKRIFLIGHNPGLNNLTNYLVSSFNENIPTCGILKINFDINSWKNIKEDSGELDFFKYPKMSDT